MTDLKGAALSTGEWRAASHLPLRSIGVCVCVGGHIGQWALVHLSSQDKSRGVLLSVAAGSGAVRVWYPCASEVAGLPLGHPSPGSLRAVQGCFLLPWRRLLVPSSFLFASDVVKHQVLPSAPDGSLSGTLLSGGILMTTLRYTPCRRRC